MKDQIHAGQAFVERFDAIFPVEFALWLKGSELSRWRLYIASRSVDEKNSVQAYLAAARLASSLPELDIDSAQIRIIGMNDPVARAAIDFRDRYQVKMPTRYHGPQFGGIGTDEVYFYPPANVAKAP